MSDITKRALEASLKKMLLKKPVTKITISDITEDCGVNRATFYYHFKDIYDLIEWSCEEGSRIAANGNTTYDIIGFNKENVLIVGKMTGNQAVNMGIRDAVCFGPTLIVNGNPLTVAGAGSGLNPRTAIGQRADGTVLLLVIEGRQATSLGASYNDLIRVMLEYGAVNAANLDGGSSSVMYNKSELINSNASFIGLRKVPTAILIR